MKKKVLYLLAFLIKGWEVSLLLVLPFIQTQGKINLFQLGILAAIFSIFQIMSSLFAGHFSHTFGSKNIMIASIGFYVLAWFGIVLNVEFYFLTLIFSLGGLGSGLFVPLANSAIAQMADKNIGKEMGDYSAFTDLGRVLLTGMTAVLTSKLGTASLLSYGLLALFSLALLIKIKTFDISIVNAAAKIESIKLSHLLKIKNYVLSIFTGIGDSFASSSLFIFIPLLLVPKGIALDSVGLLSALFFLGYAIGRMLLGRLADQYGSITILIISEVLMTVLIILLVFVNNLFLVSITLFLLGIVTRGTSPIIRGMVAKSIYQKERFDKAYSLYSFSVNSSVVISRSIYGFLAATLGIASVFYFSGFVALLTIAPLSLFHKSSSKI